MKKYDIESISYKMIECITDLFDYFDLDYTDSDRTISFPCPIHGGDNEFGSSILKEDIGNWQCYTRQCHEDYGGSIIQFTQALLTVVYEKQFTFSETIDWCAQFVGEKPLDNNINKQQNDILDFIRLCKYINHKKESVPQFTPRHLVKKSLTIPSSYYIDRGYTPEIISKFDVGYCHNKNKPFFGRTVIPCYDDDGKYMIGCTSRSLYEKCPKCNLYHNPSTRCPITPQEKLKYSKWRNSSNLDASKYLYNFWNAQQHIQETSTVILVEGPGDVWRMEEAGIFNSVAILKSNLSKYQRYILEESGTVNIIVATDNDDAGKKAYRSIYDQCKRLFSVYQLKYNKEDIGSMEVEDLKKITNKLLDII